MSGSIGQYGSTGAASALRQSVASLSNQQQVLEQQTSTGVASDSYAGLGNNRTLALSLQPAITQVSAWSDNITTAQNQLSVTQTALGGIGSIASSLSTTLTSLSGNPTSSTVQVAVTQARQALQTLGSVLNTRSGNAYVFAGVQSGTAPVSGNTDLSTSALATTISGLVGQMGSLGASGVLDQSLQAAGATTGGSPFSTTLSVSPAQAATLASRPALGAGETSTIGVVATQGGEPTSTSTGSPVRDLIRNLAIVASLGKTTIGSPDYESLIRGLSGSMSAVSTGITGLSASVGVTQDTLKTRSTTLDQMTTSLTQQLGNSKDVDLAAVSTQLATVQDSLQASYSVIADMKGMTLADYI